MELITYVIVAALIAWLNYYLAEQRGRNEVGWSFAGVIFGLFSTVLLLILGKTKEKEMEILVEANKKAASN